MTILSPVSNATGSMSQEDINAENISNLMDTVNEMQSSSGNVINQPTYVEINDGTTNRALMGFNQTTGTWGLFAVPAGTDLADATDPQQFSFSSDLQSVISPLNGTITIPGGVATGAGQASFAATPIPHGLDYTPAVIGFANGPVITNYPSTSNINTILPVSFYTDSLNVQNQLIIGTDAANIYAYNNVDYFVASPTIPPWPITYYLLNVTA
jgi:hypothetical protein